MYLKEAKSEASSSSVSSLLLSLSPVILAEKFTRIISAGEETDLSFLKNFEHANIWDHVITAWSAKRIFVLFILQTNLKCKSLWVWFFFFLQDVLIIWPGLKKKKPLYNWSQVVQHRGQTLGERALNKETNKNTKVVVYLPIKVHRYTTVKSGTFS